MASPTPLLSSEQLIGRLNQLSDRMDREQDARRLEINRAIRMHEIRFLILGVPFIILIIAFLKWA